MPLTLKFNKLAESELAAAEKALSDFGDKTVPGLGLSFNVFKWSLPEMRGFVLGMFKQLGTLDFLCISPSALLDFVCDVEGLYLHNPYHNFFHGVDVLFMVYYMLHHMEVAMFLEKHEIAGVAIAALCHDIGHPGLNNVYQTNARTQLARLYKDSILERNSIALTMTLLEKHKLLANIPAGRSEWSVERPDDSLGRTTARDEAAAEEIRRVVYDVIMATDMQRHFDLLEKFVNITESIAENDDEIEDEPTAGASDAPLSASSPSLVVGDRNLFKDGDEFAEEESAPLLRSAAKSGRPQSPLTTVTMARHSSNDLNDQDNGRVDSDESDDDEILKISDSMRTTSASSPTLCDVPPGILSPLGRGWRPFTATQTVVTDSPDNFAAFPASLSSPSFSGSGLLATQRRSNHLPNASNSASPQSRRMGSDVFLFPRKFFSQAELPPVSLTRDQRQTLSEVLVHAADISNTVRPWSLCKRWSDAVIEEFFLQGDIEKKNKLPVSQNMDREHSDQTQIGLKFGELLVRPFFAVLADFMPEGHIFLEALASNRCHWSSLASSSSVAPAAPATGPAAASPSKTMAAVERAQALTLPLPLPPPGRRVSIAAGTVIIPVDLHERLKRYTVEGRKVSRSLSGSGSRDPKFGHREYWTRRDLETIDAHAESDVGTGIFGSSYPELASTRPMQALAANFSQSRPEDLTGERQAARWKSPGSPQNRNAASMLVSPTSIARGAPGPHPNAQPRVRGPSALDAGTRRYPSSADAPNARLEPDFATVDESSAAGGCGSGGEPRVWSSDRALWPPPLKSDALPAKSNSSVSAPSPLSSPMALSD